MKTQQMKPEPMTENQNDYPDLTQLLQAGILEHNGEKANKVRYMVANSLQR